MTAIERQPISARIRADLAEYLETYREKHSLATRTDALEEAILALKQREREQELREGYRQEALDYARCKNKDPWIDSDLKDTLEAIDRG
jgi:hypothetical protein